jgi:hypothetical protein
MRMNLETMLPLLRCPRSGGTLAVRRDTLVSSSGQVYPLVAGKPVLVRTIREWYLTPPTPGGRCCASTTPSGWNSCSGITKSAPTAARPPNELRCKTGSTHRSRWRRVCPDRCSIRPRLKTPRARDEGGNRLTARCAMRGSPATLRSAELEES